MIEGADQPSGHNLETQATRPARYEALVALLREARSNCEGAGEQPMLWIVNAAFRACGAWGEAWEEVEWHRQAYARAHRRQRQLREELSALIDQIEMPGGRLTSPLPTTHGALSIESQRLIKSIKDLLIPERGTGDNPSATAQVSEEATERSDPEEAYDLRGPAPGLWHDNLEAETTTPVVRPSLAIYFLSPFRVLLDEQPVEGWPNCKGKSIFKYLVTHRERPIPKEVLMDVFWPEVDPDAARNNLNVAIYGLRKALSKVNPDFSYVLFQDGFYLLNPELNIWVDAEVFLSHVRLAKEYERQHNLDAAIQEYRSVETIYQSEFLVEDRYDEWLIATRQKFKDTYLAVMERLSSHYFERKDYETCMTICAKTLAEDNCNEEVHRRLMRCYSHMGYTHLALRQFHVCRETLARELHLTPDKETQQLFEQIRQRQSL